jgi:hypothetical protein
MCSSSTAYFETNECSITTHAKLVLQTCDTALNDKSIAGRERRNYKLQAIGTCTTTHLLLCTVQRIHAILVIYGLQKA